jgi:hypothetical protein
MLAQPPTSDAVTVHLMISSDRVILTELQSEKIGSPDSLSGFFYAQGLHP